MKKHFTGFSKIFSFTFNQHVRSKGYKNTTIAIALICLLVPALLMGGIEYLGSDEPAGAQGVEGAGTADVTYDGIESLDRVMVVDMSQDKELDTSSLPAFIKAAAGKDVEVVNVGDDLETARRATVASDDALIMVIEQDGSSYTTNIVFPDSSGLPSETGDSFQTLLDQYTQVLAGMLSGESMPSVDENQDSAESMKDVVAMVVSYLNIMILYFFVLVYGQGVANSVVMEKSSKLMETFLISVKPTAMILGKLLAITATGIIQLLTWIISLAVSFAAGTAIVKTINPETDMFIIKGFAMLKELLDGLLSPANCIMAILMVVAGLLLYCALAGIGGALASKTEDLSSANAIFTLILVVSFFGALAGGGLEPSSEGSALLDWIPFTSVMITPGRILMGTLPLWKALACFAITLITALLATAAAGKVYRSMVFYKGDLPKPKDILKLIRGV